MDEEILSDEELEKVAGGAVRECTDICKLAAEKDHVSLGLHQVQDYLKKYHNIDAKIDIGDVFACDNGNPNVYKYNGEIINHSQVLEIIRAKK